MCHLTDSTGAGYTGEGFILDSCLADDAFDFLKGHEGGAIVNLATLGEAIYKYTGRTTRGGEPGWNTKLVMLNGVRVDGEEEEQ